MTFLSSLEHKRRKGEEFILAAFIHAGTANVAADFNPQKQEHHKGIKK